MASISAADRKLLWGRSGNECAFPQCAQNLTMAAGAGAGAAPVPLGSSPLVVVGEEAHIVAERDDGPRGDPSMPVPERNAYPNLVLLCPTHHTLVDKDHGVSFSVGDLRGMKAAHEESVEKRLRGTIGSSARRADLLLEAASEGRGRLVASWVAAGVGADLAQALADDQGIGAPARLAQALPPAGMVVLEGDFGSGKSVTGERVHAAAVAAALEDDGAPVPVHLDAKAVGGSLADAVREAAAGVGDPWRVGLRLVLNGLDEPGPGRAAELLNEARCLVHGRNNCQIVATARPGLQLSPEEKITYPPLDDQEAEALVGRLGVHPSLLRHGPESVNEMLRLPLFLIIAAVRQLAGAEIPRSEGTFLQALADGALQRSHAPQDQARQALLTLARLSTDLGGPVPAAELGGDDAVRSVLETRLVVRANRALKFALPVIEQYFAAQSVLESGAGDLNLEDVRQLDQWRYPLLLAVTIGSWQQVTRLLDHLTMSQPGLASWLVTEALPRRGYGGDAVLPGSLECARRLRHSLTAWLDALGPLGRMLGLTDSTGRPRTVGAFTEAGQRLSAGLKLGDTAGTGLAQLPYGLNPFTGRAPDGSEWRPLLSGGAQADFAAWPWQLSLQWVSAGIEAVLRSEMLNLPGTAPFQAERRWAVARAVTGQTTHLAHRPLAADDVRTAARQFQSRLAARGASRGRPSRHRRIVVNATEIEELLQEIDTGELADADGMIHRPYLIPDVNLAGGSTISDLYSGESLRQLTEDVYGNALIIYRDLVSTWFPGFAQILGLMSILPVVFRGLIVPRSSSFSGPDFFYDMDVLPPGDPVSSEVRVAAEPPVQEWRVTIEEMRRLRDRISALHPGAERWAHPRAGLSDLWVYGDAPATAQACQWLWEDLRGVHMITSVTPILQNW